VNSGAKAFDAKGAKSRKGRKGFTWDFDFCFSWCLRVLALELFGGADHCSMKIAGFGDEAAEQTAVIDEPARDEVDHAAFLLHVAFDAQ
jgi:hypothetical protein